MHDEEIENLKKRKQVGEYEEFWIVD